MLTRTRGSPVPFRQIPAPESPVLRFTEECACDMKGLCGNNGVFDLLARTLNSCEQILFRTCTYYGHRVIFKKTSEPCTDNKKISLACHENPHFATHCRNPNEAGDVGESDPVSGVDSGCYQYYDDRELPEHCKTTVKIRPPPMITEPAFTQS